MRLADLTWPEAGERAAGGLVVPIGSTEQHGPHLPLSTDTDIAAALCDLLELARPAAVVAPPIAYGSSGEHRGFAGTISIGQEALELVLVELGRSAAETFDRILLVSAHGGNAAPVNRAVQRLRAESRDVRCWMPRWVGDAHAGRVETALQLALDARRVHLDRAVAGNATPILELLPRLRESSVREVSASGVLGDPAGATSEAGQALLETLAADLIRCYDASSSAEPAP